MEKRTKRPEEDDELMDENRAEVPIDEQVQTVPYNNRRQLPSDGVLYGIQGDAPPEVQMRKPIGEEQIHEAQLILQKYKEGKANLEKRIVENEQWYKLRHWETLRKSGKTEVEPVSGWLFNCIANKHADAMDAYPSPNILPREEQDEEEAKKLESIIPVVLEQCDFEQVYSDVWDYKLKSGTGIYGVFWDGKKLNGLGDIAIEKVDIINLFWESGIMDIQKSRNLFHVALVDNDVLEESYPKLHGKLGNPTMDISKYIYDDTVDTNNKSVVVDWYYKINQNGKNILHYCKYVNDEVLFATENEPEYSEKGWYDHGLYPFVFDKMFGVEGTPCGFGYIDVGKSAQEYIDRSNQALMQNMIVNTRPRYFIRNDGSVNEKEYADLSNDFVHVDGNLGQDSVSPIATKTLDDIYVTLVNNKIEELKEVTGNRDFSQGGTTSGVTAASAIAALQETGSKLSRDSSKSAYRAYRRLIEMVIELIRQFYDLPRQFRIIGENASAQYIQYSNEGITQQSQGGSEFGVDMGYRLPVFDVSVVPEKTNAYSRLSQNEMALQFMQAGFFNPQMADQALMCLDMMEFTGKDKLISKIAQQGGMYQTLLQTQQQMLMLAQMVDQDRGTNISEQIASGIMGNGAVIPPDAKQVEGSERAGTKNEGSVNDDRIERAKSETAQRNVPD